MSNDAAITNIRDQLTRLTAINNIRNQLTRLSNEAVTAHGRPTFMAALCGFCVDATTSLYEDYFTTPTQAAEVFAANLLTGAADAEAAAEKFARLTGVSKQFDKLLAEDGEEFLPLLDEDNADRPPDGMRSN
jgi:hypothetical protein